MTPFESHVVAGERSVNPGRLIGERHQFRLVLCGHKAVEVGAVCLVLMVQGNLAEVTFTHFLIATKTGLLAVSPALGLTFTRYARHFVNRWTSSALLGLCTFLADALSHPSHYRGAYLEAFFTALGAFFFSLVISFTPIGKRIDRLAEWFAQPSGEAVDPAAHSAEASSRSSSAL
jgi:hypothetical protein